MSRYSGKDKKASRGDMAEEFRQRRILPEWRRGFKGCFVCGQDHRENQRHSSDEVTEAVKSLKNRHPTVLLVVEDLKFVTNLCKNYEQETEADVVI